MKPISVEIYSRPGCHLCDDAKEVIERVRKRFDFSVSVINIDSDPKLKREYGELIPVVFINGTKVFTYLVDESAFEEKVKTFWKT